MNSTREPRLLCRQSPWSALAAAAGSVSGWLPPPTYCLRCPRFRPGARDRENGRWSDEVRSPVSAAHFRELRAWRIS
jgi:hypothetical protein